MRFSPRRLVAEALALVGYRRFQKLYWQLRACDMQTRYTHTDDFPVLEDLIRRYAVTSVVDLGCGDGRLFDMYKRVGVTSVYGVELSENQCAAARARVSRGAAPAETRVECGNLCDSALRLPDSDLVVASRALQHIAPADIEGVVARACRAARKLVFVNELMTTRTSAAYIFVHDYDCLFGAHGLKRLDSGVIPRIGYEYCVYEKNT